MEAAEGAGSVVEEGLPPGEQGVEEPADASMVPVEEMPAAPAPKSKGRKK